MMSKQPEYHLCMKGEMIEDARDARDRKWAWHRVGAAWVDEGGNGLSVTFEFPAPVVIQPGTKMRLFVNKPKEER